MNPKVGMVWGCFTAVSPNPIAGLVQHPRLLQNQTQHPLSKQSLFCSVCLTDCQGLELGVAGAGHPRG